MQEIPAIFYQEATLGANVLWVALNMVRCAQYFMPYENSIRTPRDVFTLYESNIFQITLLDSEVGYRGADEQEEISFQNIFSGLRQKISLFDGPHGCGLEEVTAPRDALRRLTFPFDRSKAPTKAWLRLIHNEDAGLVVGSREYVAGFGAARTDEGSAPVMARADAELVMSGALCSKKQDCIVNNASMKS